tara:strand:+ start:6244 stop:6897 length:654 start_codon:yes stop_codon:yes gene_type:complete
MPLQFSLKLLNEEAMQKQILKAVLERLKWKWEWHAEALKNTFGVEVMAAITESPTYKSMDGGVLQEEFGLVSGAHGMDQIIMGIINSSNMIIREPKISGNRITGSMRIESVPLDLSEFHDIAQQVTEKGQRLPWFKWLTTLGDAIIVRDFEVQAGFPKSSRTGDKIMVKGSGWRVPPEHAGSEGNNFITKAVDEIMPRLEKHVEYWFLEAIMTGKRI